MVCYEIYEIKHPHIEGKVLEAIELKGCEVSLEDIIDSLFRIADERGLQLDYVMQEASTTEMYFISGGVSYAPIDCIELITIEKEDGSDIKEITIRVAKDFGQPSLLELM